MSAAGEDFCIDDWLISPQRLCIERADEAVHLKPKSMAVLERLALAEGKVVLREELFEAVWPGAIVSDDVLTQSIVELRKAFGDTARNARFIETIPRRGFRLLPAVLDVDTAGLHPDLLVPGTSSVASNTTELTGRPAPVGVGKILIAAGSLLIAILGYYLVTHDARRPTLTVNDDPLLVVLPFTDLSPAGNQEYFTDGLTEEVLNRLARLQGLQVIGRSSSFAFKGKNEPLETIARTLNVTHVVEGSVRKSSDRIRISAQLVNVADKRLLWSENFDRQIDDIFIVQDEIASAVATALSIKLGVGGIGELSGGTRSVEAYNEVLLGQSLYRQFTRESLLMAIEHFRRATETDPEYAWAWERLADIYSTARFVVEPRTLGDWERLSEEALVRALQLAPDSPAIQGTAAFRQVQRRQWAEAEQILNRGKGLLNSSDQQWLINYSTLLMNVGRVAEATVLMERARRRDPLSSLNAFYLGHLYRQSGQFDRALEELDRGYRWGRYLPLLAGQGLSASLEANSPTMISLWLGRALEYRSDELPLLEAMRERLGDTHAALSWLRERYALTPQVTSLFVLWVAYYGDNGFALSIMIEQSRATAQYWNPMLTEVRRQAQFKQLVRDTGLLDYWREYGWGDYCTPVGQTDFECH